MYFEAKQTDQIQTSNELSAGAIAGIVIGILMFTLIMNLIIVICLKVKSLRHTRTSKPKGTLLPTAHVKSDILTGSTNILFSFYL